MELYHDQDTICAISTPLGIGGIGILRMSGPDALRIIREIFKPHRRSRAAWKSHTVRYGHIFDRDRIIDEVLVTVMLSPRSYTREDMVEIGCHGGLAALKSVLKLCIAHGARFASPGEFTRRAFLNGRIDIVQAESILDIINARTERALEISLKQLGGSLSRKIRPLRDRTLDLLVRLEGEIDFAEEHAIDSTLEHTGRQIKEIIDEAEKIVETGRTGKVFTEGFNVAIVGKPNVGKSSLLNLLTEEDRAIVSEIPGTTRDAIEAVVSIKGIPLKVVDTAGIWNPDGKIEQLSVERARQWMNKAEIVLLVLDGSQPLDRLDIDLVAEIASRQALVLINKSDLPASFADSEIPVSVAREKILRISALTGKGLEHLKERLYHIIESGIEQRNPDFFLNIRQEQALSGFVINLKEAAMGLENNEGLDIIAECVRTALRKLDDVASNNVSEEVLDAIFQRFCIGK